ncbi:hypothetical protein [Absidia glauca]|uniref:Uncharacterized protein n=1 Tax=Absidia glauca TaxID=4829 RepID=A0A163JD52_ABSGL|nr:hypothetical protein [Absidia glauca]
MARQSIIEKYTSIHPGARKPISVAIPFDHPRKKVAMMQNANVSHGKQQAGKKERRKDLPCVRRLRSLYRGRIVRGGMIMSMERKKVMKKQRQELMEK